MAANEILTRLLANYSSVNLIAGAGILGNVGGVTLAANTNLGNNISAYNSMSVVSRYANIVASAVINANSAITFATGASTFPALTNSIPTLYANIGNSSMTTSISLQSNNIMGSGDLGKFHQVLSSAKGLITVNNELINSVVAANSTSSKVAFVNSDNVITGGLSGISQSFAAFGADITNLGDAVSFANLNGLGSPETLLRQLLNNLTLTPAVNTALLQVGISQDVIENIPTDGLTDSQQKLAYEAMTKVTGFDLFEVQQVLKCTTLNLNTMADLLDPIKLFPRSFDTLTAPTVNGLRGVYLNSTGVINSNLATQLPPSVLAPLGGNPLQNMNKKQP